ncbi:MAG: hypothetical protein JNN20_19060 [Betaproteobacteria bacterium]|nr:hypothetical protein [Betaproteobacteria bacterium]
MTFGAGGRVVTGFPAEADNGAGAAQDTQAIYIAATCIEMGQGKPCVTRILLDGVVDVAFSANAKLPGNSGPYAGFSSVAVSHGRVIAAGNCLPNARPCVARFLADGSTDNGFGNAGVQSLPLDSSLYDVLAAQGAQIAVKGYCVSSRTSDFCLAQVQNQLPPLPPLLLQATGGDGSIAVAFSPPPFNGGETITGYSLACNGGGVAIGLTSPLQLTGLNNGQSYQCTLSAINTIGASAPIAFTLTPTVSPVTLLAVLSRKIHGAAGTFEIELDRAQSLTGTVTVEPRSAAKPHLLVFQFSGPILNVGNPVVTGVDGLPAGTAVATIRGNDVEVSLEDIGYDRRVTVSLPAINSTQGTVSVSLGFLTGDGSRSRAVNAADISGVKAQVGQPVGANNFRFDIDASGSINALDVQAVKARTGIVLR